MKSIKVNLDIKWYEILLFCVEAGLLVFGGWALVDSLLIGSTVAGWRFFFLFFVWSLPGAAILIFLRPRKDRPKAAKTGELSKAVS